MTIQETQTLIGQLEASAKLLEELSTQLAASQTLVGELKAELDKRKHGGHDAHIGKLDEQGKAMGKSIAALKVTLISSVLFASSELATCVVGLLQDRLAVRFQPSALPVLYTPEAKGLCSVCHSVKVDVVLEPCLHQPVCQGCVGRLGGRCPVCDRSISNIAPLSSASGLEGAGSAVFSAGAGGTPSKGAGAGDSAGAGGGSASKSGASAAASEADDADDPHAEDEDYEE
jgi:hypothetical protein